MGDAKELFEVSESTVLVDGRPLAVSAEGFQVLLHGDRSHAAWLRNADGFFYLESDMAPWTLKKLKCGALEVIDRDYARDEKTVYWGATPIPGSDPATFKVVKQERPLVYYFAHDQNQLYALSDSAEGLQIWTDVDIASLEFFDEKDFFADRDHLYQFNWHFITYLNPKGSAGLSEFQDTLRQRHPDADAWWNWSDDYLAGLRDLGYAYRGDDRRVFYHFAEGNFDYPFGFGLCQDAPFHLVVAGADPAWF